MRIVFLIRCFLYYTAPLANALAKLGHEVTIISSDAGGEFVGSGSRDVKTEYREWLDPRVNLEWVRFPQRVLSKALCENLRCIVEIIGLIRRHRPDVLHLHDVADCRIFTAVALTRRRYRLVLTVHDAELHPGDTSNKTEFMRPCLRRIADAVIVHGDDIKHRLMAVSRISEEKIHCIPIGAYLFYRRWLWGDTNADRKKVLFFGRVNKYKGLEYLINSAPVVCREIPDAKFVIAGSGPEWPRCKALIQNPENFVLLEGSIYDPDVTRLFEEAAVVVLPYIEASQSGVLAIAYALGKPVVVTNVGSLPEVVEDGVTGLVVPPRDVEALSDAIVRLLKDPELRKTMGAKAYEIATTGELSWDNVAIKTDQAYKAAIAHRRRPR